MSQELSIETFSLDPVGSHGGGFRYSVYGSDPICVIENIDDLLVRYQDLYLDQSREYIRSILIEITASVTKTTEDYAPSIPLLVGDEPDKYVRHYETWHVCDVYEVRAIASPRNEHQ